MFKSNDFKVSSKENFRFCVRALDSLTILMFPFLFSPFVVFTVYLWWRSNCGRNNFFKPLTYGCHNIFMLQSKEVSLRLRHFYVVCLCFFVCFCFCCLLASFNINKPTLDWTEVGLAFIAKQSLTCNWNIVLKLKYTQYITKKYVCCCYYC